MHRYNQNNFTHSFTSANPNQINERLATSSDMVIIQQDANLIHQQLSEVQTRLKILSKSNKPSANKQLNSYLKSTEKMEVRNNSNKISLNNKIQKKLSFTPNKSGNKKKSHLQEIRYHLEQLQHQLYEQKQGGYSQKLLKQRIYRLQQCEKLYKQQINELQFGLQKMKVEFKNQKEQIYSKLQKKYESELLNKQQQFKNQISELKINFNQTIRQQKLNSENAYLLKEQQFVNQIDLLANSLQSQVNKYNKIKAQFNGIQQQHVKRICQLQAQIQKLKSQLHKAKQDSKIQRQLKIQYITKNKQIQQQNKNIKQLNKKITTQISTSKTNLQKHLTQTIPILEIISSFIQILNKINIHQLPSCIIMIRSQLNHHRADIHNIISKKYLINNEGQSSCLNELKSTTERTNYQKCVQSQDSSSDSVVRSSYEDKQNLNYINSNMVYNMKMKRNQNNSNNKHLNLLNIYADTYNNQSKSNNDLYKMLLVQAASIQNKMQNE